MHAAPAVQVDTTSGGLWRIAQAGAYTVAAAALAAWAAGWCGAEPGTAAAAAGSAAVGVAGWWIRRAAPPPRRLRWDGARWSLAGPGGRSEHTGTVAAALDLGGWMLLRFRADGGGAAQWLPVGRRGQAGAWPGLRAAVYAAAHGDAMTAR